MLAAAAGFALLLGVAAWRKVGDLGVFEAVLADYRLLPALLVRPAAIVTPAVEAVLAVAWVAAPWRPDAALVAGLGTAGLMLGYGLAMTTNLARGRSWIDCGCGGGEELSWVLVGRNVVLAGLALGPLALAGTGTPHWGDLATSVPVLAVGAALYFATGALLANVAAMRAWTEE